jgi:EmrB/QacA subfamily drug resistance transporter
MTSSTAATARVSGVLAATCLSTLVVNANTSAVSILLPAISEDTGTSVDTLQWAVTGYSLVGAAVIVTSGSLGDVFGRRRVFQLGLALFVVSCVFIGLSSSGGAVIAGRFIQGAAGATILACGLSLLTVANSGAEQLRAVSLWGAAAAVGAAAGPLVGGLLVDLTGWQGLFWIDAVVGAVCMVITRRSVQESRDENRSRSIDYTGSALIALTLGPLILALSKGSDWGWASAATLGCLALALASGVAFVLVEQRVTAPLVDLRLLRNRVLVGSTLAILIVAGTINGLMYVLSLYFQNPAGLGLSAFEAGLATLPAGAAMIAITPAIAPLAAKLGGARAVAIGFGLATVGFAALAFVQASWEYWAFLAPLVGLSVGLGLANGPASSGSTSAVSADEVGQASGISNMSRYVGAAVAVAAVATINNTVAVNHEADGDSASEALAAGLAGSALLMAILSAAGVLLVGLMRRQHIAQSRGVAAAITTHTIPVQPAAS